MDAIETNLVEIEHLEKLIALLNKRNVHQFDKVVNLCLYSMLNHCDIKFLYESFINENNVHKRNLFGRILCMSLIEFLEDINFLLGKELLKELEKNNMDVFIDSIKAVNKEYANLKKRHNSILREIRNNASAHKNKDASRLLAVQKQLPTDLLQQLVQEIFKFENRLNQITFLIYLEMSVQIKTILRAKTEIH